MYGGSQFKSATGFALCIVLVGFGSSLKCGGGTSLGMFSEKGCGFSAAVLYLNAPVLLACIKGRRFVISCSAAGSMDT